jgi:hypothetical protein
MRTCDNSDVCAWSTRVGRLGRRVSSALLQASCEAWMIFSV